jgi:hypothetical protein
MMAAARLARKAAEPTGVSWGAVAIGEMAEEEKAAVAGVEGVTLVARVPVAAEVGVAA